MEAINERVAQLVKALGHTPTSFGKKIGKAQSSVAVIVDGRSKPGFEFLELVCTYFPEVSRDWLMVGEGEMFRQAITQTNKASDGGSFGAEVLGRVQAGFEEMRRVFEGQLSAKDQQIASLQRMLEATLGKSNDVTPDRSSLRTHPATERLMACELVG
ncbi:helix-turn-helix domain-containing protein [Fibrella forsythiae]|uniref:Helix-turn-helix transcriptional regulator n=1 Tax=Fibrella forsythiae TaxID=2817061 RepID=A0ABS3JM55_9BACT|nr:helix-turn-helix transcriptional regulator [Fibrella forsythiae]MBO0951087.1 helix-turn-helix transcriptional regulator [Fibrella forsythiae]